MTEVNEIAFSIAEGRWGGLLLKHPHCFSGGLALVLPGTIADLQFGIK